MQCNLVSVVFLQTNLDFEVLIKISLKEELNMSKSKPMIHH